MISHRWPSASLLILSALAIPAFGSDARPSVFTSAQARAGKVAYESTCGLCHLSSLRGRTGGPEELPDPETLPDNYQKTLSGAGGYVPALVGEEFLAKWGPKTAGEFAKRILEATKGFPPNGNDEKTFLAVAAYILQANGAAAGRQELTTINPVQVRVAAASTQQGNP
jgi:mono/diheme cytochrome c family protein